MLDKHDFPKCILLNLCTFDLPHGKDARKCIRVTEGMSPSRQEKSDDLLSIALKVLQVLTAYIVGVRGVAPGIPLRTLRRIQEMGKSSSKIAFTREAADDTNITLHLAVLT